MSSLTTWPGNPRRGNLDKIKESLEANGQFRAIVVQESTGQICAGNHTFLAAEDLDATEIAAHVLALTDDEAERILVADNATGDGSEYDDAEYAAVLQGIIDRSEMDAETALLGTGVSEDDYRDILDRLADEGDKSLADLAEEVGPPADDDLWPTLKMRVPPSARNAFLKMTELAPNPDDDGSRFVLLLKQAGWDGL